MSTLKALEGSPPSLSHSGRLCLQPLSSCPQEGAVLLLVRCAASPPRGPRAAGVALRESDFPAPPSDTWRVHALQTCWSYSGYQGSLLSGRFSGDRMFNQKLGLLRQQEPQFSGGSSSSWKVIVGESRTGCGCAWEAQIEPLPFRLCFWLSWNVACSSCYRLTAVLGSGQGFSSVWRLAHGMGGIGSWKPGWKEKDLSGSRQILAILLLSGLTLVCFMVTRSQGCDLRCQTYVNEINLPSAMHCVCFVANLRGVTRVLSQASGEAFRELYRL